MEPLDLACQIRWSQRTFEFALQSRSGKAMGMGCL